MIEDLDYSVDSKLLLENQFGFALYAAANAIAKAFRNKLAPLGITYPQFLVLSVLWEQDGVKISDIGHRLRLDSGTLTPLIRRLERDGLVRRVRSVQDERVMQIFLSERGRDLKTDALEARRKVGHYIKMSQYDIEEMRNLLLKLVDDFGHDDSLIASPGKSKTDR